MACNQTNTGGVTADSVLDSNVGAGEEATGTSNINTQLYKLFHRSSNNNSSIKTSEEANSDVPYATLHDKSYHQSYSKNFASGAATPNYNRRNSSAELLPRRNQSHSHHSSCESSNHQTQVPHPASSTQFRFDPVTLRVDNIEAENAASGYCTPVPHSCNIVKDMQKQGGAAQPGKHSCKNRRSITLGKPLPTIMLLVVHFLLGIHPDKKKRTITGRVFHGLTIAVAIGYLACSLVFIHKDIESDYSKTTVVDGTVSGIFTLIWCVLGVYANGLAFRLYTKDQFKAMLRMPSKTMFGINLALMLLLLMMLTMAINNYAGEWMFQSNTCHNLSLPVVACKFRYVFRVAFSVFALLWHYLVTFVLISVSRSFTITVRQLMQLLERDGRVYEAQYLGIKPVAFKDDDDDDMLLQEYTWLDEDFCSDMKTNGAKDDTTTGDGGENGDAGRHNKKDGESVTGQHKARVGEPQINIVDTSYDRCMCFCNNQLTIDDDDILLDSNDGDVNHSLAAPPPLSPLAEMSTTPHNHHHQPRFTDLGTSRVSQQQQEPSSTLSSVQILLPSSSTTHSSTIGQLHHRRKISATTQSARSSGSESSTVSCKSSSSGDKKNSSKGSKSASSGTTDQQHCRACEMRVPLMSNADILYHIWKIQTGLRIFGLATQRWMMSLMCLIVMWLAINLVLWLNTIPNLVDLVNLMLPLMLLPLLVATYAEVNFEGDRLVKFIAPSEERLGVLYFLLRSPLQLTIYGFSLSYATITTAGFGLLVALSSKVFLQEITG